VNCVVPPLIAHVINRLDYGGLENGLVNLVNHLPATLCRHAIITLTGHSDFRRRIRRDDVTLHSIAKRPGKDPGAYARMWRLLTQLRPQVMHTRNRGTVDMSWVAAAAQVPVRVHSEHGWDATDPRGENPRNIRLRRWCRPAIHRWVTVSQDLADWLRQCADVPQQRILTIVNGVDTARFSPDGPLALDAPWSAAAPERPLVFGTVGRLDAVKNQQELLRAFAEILGRFPDANLRLLIAGGGGEQQKLTSLGEELGISPRIWWAGMREDVPDILRAIDVFVLPSLNEGISNTILEAMATGVPVIASRVGGNAEIVDSGRTGLLYQAGDRGMLVQHMSHYCEQNEVRRTHGLAARIAAVERLSLTHMLARYRDFYADLLKGRTPG
jgi:sugar transferase (PEP-CTERM/EpsH1 system associated)